jgi:hypothetical protein
VITDHGSSQWPSAQSSAVPSGRPDCQRKAQPVRSKIPRLNLSQRTAHANAGESGIIATGTASAFESDAGCISILVPVTGSPTFL